MSSEARGAAGTIDLLIALAPSQRAWERKTPLSREIQLCRFRLKTPTVVLCDSKGRILRAWVGKLDPAGEQELVNPLLRY